MQEWAWTRIIDADIHDWDMFIKPDELDVALTKAGLWLRRLCRPWPARIQVLGRVELRARNWGSITTAN